MSYIVPRDKPKQCTAPKCRFLYNDSLDCRLQYERWDSFEDQYRNCPLVEIPPHGDLIERDTLHEIINWTLFRPPFSKKMVRRFIDDAPTIIEAEGSAQ